MPYLRLIMRFLSVVFRHKNKKPSLDLGCDFVPPLLGGPLFVGCDFVLLTIGHVDSAMQRKREDFGLLSLVSVVSIIVLVVRAPAMTDTSGLLTIGHVERAKPKALVGAVGLKLTSWCCDG